MLRPTEFTGMLLDLPRESTRGPCILLLFLPQDTSALWSGASLHVEGCLTICCLFLSFSSRALQTPHHSASESQLTALRNATSPSDFTLYSFGESKPTDPSTAPVMGSWSTGAPVGAFVDVWNKGTRSFSSTTKHGTTLEPLCNELEWDALVSKYLPQAKQDTKRGNMQFNFGFSCGQSTQKRTAERVVKHFGAAIPSERNGTRLPIIQRTFGTLSKILKFVGTAWTNDEFLSSHPQVVERLDVFPRSFESEFETMTLAFQPIEAGSSIKKHCDLQNCDELSQVLAVKRVVKDQHGR